MADELSDIHKDFIEALPEELQEGAAEYLPHWDKYVQEKFTNSADEIKAWEPYSELTIGEGADAKTYNVRDIPPEEMADLLAFKELADDPERFKQWYNQESLRKQYGLDTAISDDYVPDIDDATTARIAALEAKIDTLSSSLTQKEQDEAKASWTAHVDGEIAKLKTEYPSLSDEDIDDICQLATRYEPSQDIVRKGFEDFQKIVGRTEKSFFEKKTDQPKPAESGGSSNTTASPVRDFNDAGEAARVRIREALGR